MDYLYKTEPFAHQRDEFEQHRDDVSRAMWWEMGTGKTKPIIDTIAYLYETGKIRAALVLAPKAVAPNWVRTELPMHLPDRVAAKTRVLLWRTDKSKTQTYQREIEAALAHDGLLIVAMSYDGIMTEVAPGKGRVPNVRRTLRGKELAKEVLTSRPTLMVLDESARIKDPSTKRTKRVLAAGKHAAYRRALTGTPITCSPFDVWAQVQFCDPEFWTQHGCASWPAFKSNFGIFVKWLCYPDQCPHDPSLRPHCGCRTFDMPRGYQNLDDLHALVADVGSRHLRDDVLDLPPRTYEKRFFHLDAATRKTYETLKKEFMVLLENGDMITAPLVITQLLRLQQITAGYCPTDAGELVVCEPNPRIQTLMEAIEDTPHACIVWAKFNEDFRQIRAAFQAAKISFVEYIGSTSADEREHARDDFQAGKAKVFLANPACAGEGLTLTAARTSIYYNTTFRLADRLQSEARPYRAGQKYPVHYIDLVAEDSVDERVIESLVAKKDLADLIMGDPRGNWL